MAVKFPPGEGIDAQPKPVQPNIWMVFGALVGLLVGCLIGMLITASYCAENAVISVSEYSMPQRTNSEYMSDAEYKVTYELRVKCGDTYARRLRTLPCDNRGIPNAQSMRYLQQLLREMTPNAQPESATHDRTTPGDRAASDEAQPVSG